MLPFMGQALVPFLQDIVFYSVEFVISDFTRKPKITEKKIIKATAQIQDPDKLEKDVVDFSLKYVKFHAREKVKINDYVLYKEDLYRIFSIRDNSEYGFFSFMGEEVKKSKEMAEIMAVINE